MIGWIAGTRIGRWLVGAAMALAALAGIWAAGRREGQRTAKADALKKDVENADKIRERAEDARRGVPVGNVTEWLRQQGRLRDE